MWCYYYVSVEYRQQQPIFLLSTLIVQCRSQSHVVTTVVDSEFRHVTDHVHSLCNKIVQFRLGVRLRTHVCCLTLIWQVDPYSYPLNIASGICFRLELNVTAMLAAFTS